MDSLLTVCGLNLGGVADVAASSPAAMMTAGGRYLMPKSRLLQKGQLMVRPEGGLLMLTKHRVQMFWLQQSVWLMFLG